MKSKLHAMIIGMVMLALLTVFIGVYSYLYLQIKYKNTKASILIQEIKEETTKQEELARLKRTISATNADREKLSSHFVLGSKAVGFLETIEGYGKTARTTLSITTADIDTEHNTFKITLIAKGTFTEVYHYLQLLENTPYQFQFNKITFDHGSATTGTEAGAPSVWNLNVGFTLISFIAE